ncbi:hypothetical protein N9H53_00565 [Flavobacteriaceae bacterium]|jgi:hypothetical protein|nr:hypothetical protein [Flavobacteriaceae bacterium]MDA7807906.1 hypothetical protein [Flavobacteriaceae bacterium]MDA9037203.1 hypothetical protein [Flavobacteriaceae bacterium]
MTELSAQDLLKHIENKIAEGAYKDSVHKITLITTRDVIRTILNTEF